ncbi:Putative peptidoglycan binding domain-containing protein [Clostridium acidisoli DSM 12555]|uniref:Putative peptidoglycan binding domain-containing protein n=1 Tax=Clostridium acidisoli DSM 12555 TaxID=1121291 RepID=A0A1W1X5Z5_9CLOT|nr:GH25 family lysozyme [Clostridium acidisoli]SMC19277.1 Putative peptidoglycan binding domain-containing protein [Clostridium acidisoli DSM 12555]
MFRGIDIYSEDNVTDWNAVKASNIQAVYIKASDGISYINPKMDSQYHGAKSVGLLVGFYHFAERNSAIAEYQHFNSVISKYQQDLKPCLDYEVSIPDMNFVSQFMAQNPNLILYSSHNITDISRLPISKIWVAEPQTNPSNTKGYGGIQYSWTGRVNGISNNEVDMDLFNETILNNGINAPVTINNIQESVQVMVIKMGENSNRVRLLQSILNVLIGGVSIDGDFGKGTYDAVVKYQEIMHLSVDGEVGENTINTLLNDLKNNWFKL